MVVRTPKESRPRSPIASLVLIRRNVDHSDRLVDLVEEEFEAGHCQSNFSGPSGAVLASGMSNPFRYFNSSPEVIRLVVMLYVRYPCRCATSRIS